MKIGDKVRIHDGSWAMVSDNDGVPKSIMGTILIADGEYEVIGIGCYDDKTHKGHYDEDCDEVNDVMCRCVRNPGRVVWTQMCFCSVQ